MMARVPDFFGLGSETNIATFDYIDIASGTGMVSFYAGHAYATVGGHKLLSNFKYYSSLIYTTANHANGAAVAPKLIDLDFDVLINKPITLKGKAIINIPVATNSDGASEIAPIVGAAIYKWNGVTETLICTDAYNVWTAYTSATKEFKMATIDLTVPLTIFKKGEYLRLNIYMGDATKTTAYDCYVGHDPMARTDAVWTSTAVPSILTFQCPTRIDV